MLQQYRKRETLSMSSRSSDRKYRIFRAIVVRRDKVCVICGSRYRRSAHHINSWKYFPLERYDTENGVTLCGGRGCHNAFHTMFKNSYREKATKKDWLNFLDLVNYIKGLK